MINGTGENETMIVKSSRISRNLVPKRIRALNLNIK